MQNQFYTLAAHWWPEGNLILQDGDGDTLLTFPIAFLTQGQVATWDYVYEVLGMCFTGGINLATLDGTAETRSDPIVAETLVVTSDGEFVMSARGRAEGTGARESLFDHPLLAYPTTCRQMRHSMPCPLIL